VGTKRVRGVELGFSGNITPEWNVFGGYTYQPPRCWMQGPPRPPPAAFRLCPGGGHRPSLPQHARTQLHLFTNYKVTPRFTLGGGAIYVDKVYGGFPTAGAW
jgi:catecholate siderophore receptor